MTAKQNEFLQPRKAADDRIVNVNVVEAGVGPRVQGRRGRRPCTDRSCVRAFGAATLAAMLLCGTGSHAQQAAKTGSEAASGPLAVPAALTSAPRPTIPSTSPEIWFVPERPSKPDKTVADFANGVRLLQNARYADALPLLSAPGLAGTPLAQYSAYYTGVAYLNLSRAAEARTVFAKLRAGKAPGYLSEAAPMREAEAAVAQGDQAGAAKIYEELSNRKTANPDGVLLALGRAQAAGGDQTRAKQTFARLYYEFPLSDLATMAATELEGLKDLQPVKDSPARLKLEIGRAERLYGAKRYQQARQAFEALKPYVSGDDAELVALRIAESDHYMRRYREARDEVQPYLEHASRKAEAEFFYLTATRELGDHDQYVQRARALVSAYPQESWAEETLNNLATHYILTDQDDEADAVFRELYQRFPEGRHAERAAWKAGWYSYKHGRYQEAVALFEGAATTFPRSDYRPAYLYWSARARDAAGDKTGGLAVMKVVASDYLNSYYGRLATKRLGTQVAAKTGTKQDVQSASARKPAEAGAADTKETGTPDEVIRVLLSLELYDAARDELLCAQRNGNESPAINATLAWVYNKLGDYRRGIIWMKRAYPTYMSAEAAALPGDLLKVIFPIDYWPLIRRYAPANNLDPYLVAALINQESSFLADAKSSANAIGLMQLLPSTARRYARSLRIKRYSAGALTRPDVNIQLGTAYFAELSRRLGGVHYALASYNAGEHRVANWTAERPGLERDEFIDDIPFPETQGYVKKIIGTAEDYRRLYGAGGRLEADGDGGRTSMSGPARTKPSGAAKAKTPAKKKTTTRTGPRG